MHLNRGTVERWPLLDYLLAFERRMTGTLRGNIGYSSLEGDRPNCQELPTWNDAQVEALGSPGLGEPLVRIASVAAPNAQSTR
jgi:hypothetical protein